MTTISVIIPAYNEEKAVTQLLDALYVNSTKKADEIIVVDTHSTDSTVEVVRDWHKKHPDCPLELILLPSKAFPGRARNIGIKAAKSEWVAFIDCGIQPANNWLERLTESFEKDPEVGVVWGICTSKGDSPWENAFSSIAEVDEGIQQRAAPNSCIRKDLIEEIGMFPPDLRAAEDLLYIDTIKNSNIKEAFSEAQVWYSGYPETFAEAFKKWALYTEYDVYANTHGYKLVRSLAQVIVLLSTVGISIFFPQPFLFLLGGLLTVTLLRVLRSVLMSTTSPRSLYEWSLAVALSVFIDAGRVAGLIKGWMKRKSRMRGSVSAG